MKNQTVNSSKEIMGGTPVFAGTRVPIQTLTDYLKAGDSTDEFLEGFPTVSRWTNVSTAVWRRKSPDLNFSNEK